MTVPWNVTDNPLDMFQGLVLVAHILKLEYL